MGLTAGGFVHFAAGLAVGAGGGAASSTGAGALVGVPALLEAGVLLAAGVTAVGAGAKTIAQAFNSNHSFSTGSGAGSGGSGFSAGGSSSPPSGAATQMVSPRSLRPTESLSSPSQATKLGRDMRAKGFDPKFPIKISQAPDGSRYIIDGHHRTAAAIRAGIKEVPAKVEMITEEEASRLFQEWAKTLGDRF